MQKSNISRFESGNYNPSLDFLSKLAKGLGKEIHIELNEFIRDMLYYEEEFEETFSDAEHFKK